METLWLMAAGFMVGGGFGVTRVEGVFHGVVAVFAESPVDSLRPMVEAERSICSNNDIFRESLRFASSTQSVPELMCGSHGLLAVSASMASSRGSVHGSPRRDMKREDSYPWNEEFSLLHYRQ